MFVNQIFTKLFFLINSFHFSTFPSLAYGLGRESWGNDAQRQTVKKRQNISNKNKKKL
jgi:hypothetical protein